MLNELITIKYLLIGILLTTGIPMALMVLSRIVGLRFRTESRSEAYRRIAAELLEESEYDELLEYCNNELEKNKNSAISHWYIARAYFEQEQYEKAKSSFAKVLEIDPSYNREHVEPFMEVINGKH